MAHHQLNKNNAHERNATILKSLTIESNYNISKSKRLKNIHYKIHLKLVLFLTIISTTLQAQDSISKSFDFNFDHQSLVVTKLIETGDFYRDVLKLKEIQHPDKAPGFRWFQINGNSQLHLIKKDIIEFKKDKSIHLSVATKDLEPVLMHLMANEIDFYNWPGEKGSVSNRSDGVKQIYIQDPDGYWIEINTAAH